MDLFTTLRELPSVAKAANVYQNDETPLDLFFFVCPKIKSPGFRLNRHHTGFFCEYLPGVAKSSNERFRRVGMFLAEIQERGIVCNTTCVFAAADSIILFPMAVTPPVAPELPEWPLKSNLELVSPRLVELGAIYSSKSWLGLPPKVLEGELDRLRSLLPPNAPENLVLDFAERSWSGFALDGILAREGHFGPNPVLLAIEGTGVAMLQNCGLERGGWLPTIHLH